MIHESSIFSRYKAAYKQFHLDNNENDWDHNYILDETTNGIDDTEYFFNEMHLMKNASVQMKTGDDQTTLRVDRLYGDWSGRVYLRAGQVAYIEPDQDQLKLPANIWIDEGSKMYMSPMVYILGHGEIAFKWNGEIIYVRHLRIVPGRVIEIKDKAMTSFFVDGEYVQGTPGRFVFASVEMGANSFLRLPSPMPLELTAGFIVSLFVC